MDCNLISYIRENMWPLFKLIRFIKRLFNYLPLIWKDEDWDYDYLYKILDFKLRRMQIELEHDTWHMDSKRRARQIAICLAYLDRYRNWTNYIDYPMDDIKFVKDKLGYKMIHTSSINEAKRRMVHGYEEFNYNMFWKRFLQWHRGWWT
jgi:hypothetical protein